MIADDIDGYAELNELAPGPKGMVLAVTATQMLERRRMLPVVGFVEEIDVSRVRTAGEPLQHVRDVADLHRAGTLEVPGERSLRARSQASGTDQKGGHHGPRILYARPANEEAVDRAQEKSK